MKAAIDVFYEKDSSTVACVVFKEWQDETPTDTKILVLPPSCDYKPGRFYLRELPCILEILKSISYPLNTIVIDGFVHLKYGKGLGAYLYESLQHKPSIIGVAKNPLKIADNFTTITRGKSKRPLFVSSIGCSLKYAADSIRSMHGPYRIPTLLKLVDTLARNEMPLNKRLSKTYR